MFSHRFKRPEFVSKPSRSNTIFATVFGSIMWLWIMYRAKNDGPYMIVRKTLLFSLLI